MEELSLSEDEWKKRLPKDRFEVLRKGGTEMPFTGKLLHNKEAGIFVCGGCRLELFSSEAKFDSGSGWPSFLDVIRSENIDTKEDRGDGMIRTEILCARCGGHLGHLFNDGPKPKGLRYCVNSSSLDLVQNLPIVK